MKKIVKTLLCGVAIAAGVFLIMNAWTVPLFAFKLSRQTMSVLSHLAWPAAASAGFFHIYNNLLREN